MRTRFIRLCSIAAVVSLLVGACSSVRATPSGAPTAAPITAAATPTNIPVAVAGPTLTPFPTVTPAQPPTPTAAATRTATPPPTQVAEALTLTGYENGIYGFKVSYPASWEEEEDNSGDSVIFSASPTAGDMRVAVDIIFDNNLDALVARAGVRMDAFRQGIPSLKVVMQGPGTTANGSPSYQYLFEYTTAGAAFRANLAFVARGSALVEYFSYAKKEEFDQRTGDFAKMLQSLQVLPLAPFGVAAAKSLVLYDASPNTFDPAQIGDVNSAAYASQVFSGLVGLDKDLKVVPELAERWDVSDGGTTYTFHLRPGVKFHSGAAVTAKDVQYSLERATSPAAQSPTAVLYLADIVGVTEKMAGKAQSISGLTVVDDATIQLKIKQPITHFLSELTHPVGFVVSRANVTAGGVAWFLAPDGTGPFRVKGWEPGVVLALQRNENYYRGVAKVPSVLIWNRGGNPVLAFKAGDVDVAALSGASIVSAKDTKNGVVDQVRATPQYSVTFFGFNVRSTPFNDVRARRAFAMALDVDALNKRFYTDIIDKATGFLPLGMAGYSDQLKGPAFDAAGAKMLWEQVKTEKALGDVRITMLVAGQSVPPLLQAVATMWKNNLGVNISFQQGSGDTAADLTGGANIFEYGWIADYPDPQNFVDILFHTGSSFNYGAYSNGAVDKVLDDARVDANPATRVPRYANANSLLVADVAGIPLNYSRDYVLVKPYVKDWLKTRQGVPDLLNASLTKPAS